MSEDTPQDSAQKLIQRMAAMEEQQDQLHSMVEGVDAAVGEQCRVLKEISRALRERKKLEEEDLGGTLGVVEAAMSELRIALGQLGGNCTSHRNEVGLRMESLEDTLGEQRISLGKLADGAGSSPGARGESAGQTGHELLLERIDAVEALLMNLDSAATGEKPRDAAQGDSLPLMIMDRLEALEAALGELRLETADDSRQADNGELPLMIMDRLESLEAALGELRLGSSGEGPEAGENVALTADRLDALEAGISETRLVLERLAGQEEVSDASMLLGQRVEALEGLLSDQDLRLRALLDSQAHRETRLNDQLDALEASISDQRHALHRMVTTFDSNAYSQRLEFQRRLADLMNNIVDQRQELHGQLAAIEAGISDQRISLMKLGTALAQAEMDRETDVNPWQETMQELTPLTEGEEEQAAAGEEERPRQRAMAMNGATPGPGRASGLHPALSLLEREEALDVERKLGIVLDCLLADHVAALARQGLDAGDLEKEAYSQLVQGLDELKLERLRARHLTAVEKSDQAREEGSAQPPFKPNGAGE